MWIHLWFTSKFEANIDGLSKEKHPRYWTKVYMHKISLNPKATLAISKFGFNYDLFDLQKNVVLESNVRLM